MTKPRYKEPQLRIEKGKWITSHSFYNLGGYHCVSFNYLFDVIPLWISPPNGKRI